MMPGSFVRVVTVTYHGHVTPGTGRRHVQVARRTIVRAPGHGELVPVTHWQLRWPVGGLGCPCGSAAYPSELSGMHWTIGALIDYATRWGGNPLGTATPKHSKGRTGAKLTPWWA